MKELLIRIDELQTLNKQLTEDHIKYIDMIKELREEIVTKDKLLSEKNNTINQQLRDISTLTYETNYANSLILGMHKEIQDLNLKLFSMSCNFNRPE